MDERFLLGFVKTCAENGVSEKQTEEYVRQYVNTALLSNPEIRKGASSVLNAYDGDLTKSDIARVMQPEILSDIIEHTVHEGKSAGAIAFRQHHPVHKILTDEFIDLVETENKQASFVDSVDNSTTRRMFQRFSQLPLSKKLALIASLGGSAGGLAGAIAPGKGGLGIGSRMLNGAFRGATLGAGSVLGSQVGKEVGALSNTGTPVFGPRSEHALAQLAGGAAGLVGTHKLLGKIGPLNA